MNNGNDDNNSDNKFQKRIQMLKTKEYECIHCGSDNVEYNNNRDDGKYLLCESCGGRTFFPMFDENGNVI